MLVGGSVLLTLYAINSEGIFEDVSSRASWISVNPEIVSVTPGVARGQRGGFTDVIVSYAGLTRTARIVVVFPGEVTPMTLLLPSDIAAGTTSQARALSGTGSTNSTDLTGQALWASSDPEVLTVTAGRITGVAPGTATVTVTSGGNTARAYMSVPPIRSLPMQPATASPN